MSSGDWWHQARCRGEDSEQWFAVFRSREAAAAQILCGACPVAVQCLAAALRAESAEDARRSGIWGGTSPRQRAAIASGSGHGTTRAPAGCRCGPCKDLRTSTTAAQRLATMRPPRPRKTA